MSKADGQQYESKAVFEKGETVFIEIKDIKVIDRRTKGKNGEYFDAFYAKALKKFEEEGGFAPNPWKLDFVFNALSDGKTKDISFRTTSIYIPQEDESFGPKSTIGTILGAFGIADEVKKTIPHHYVDSDDEINVIKNLAIGKWAKSTITHYESDSGRIYEKLDGFNPLVTKDKAILEIELKQLITKGNKSAEELHG